MRALARADKQTKEYLANPEAFAAAAPAAAASGGDAPAAEAAAADKKEDEEEGNGDDVATLSAWVVGTSPPGKPVTSVKTMFSLSHMRIWKRVMYKTDY